MTRVKIDDIVCYRFYRTMYKKLDSYKSCDLFYQLPSLVRPILIEQRRQH